MSRLVPGYDHDLFLSYASADEAWVMDFRDKLNKMFESETGHEIKIWDFRKSERTTGRWQSELKQRVKGAGAFLMIVSPPYVASDVCQSELQTFLGLNQDHRVVKIVKLPPEGDPIPDHQSIHFYEGGNRFAPNTKEFEDALLEVVRMVKRLFEDMRADMPQVYLAPEAHKELTKQGSTKNYRIRLTMELNSKGYHVEPLVPHRSNPSKEEAARLIAEKKCLCAIFLLGIEYCSWVHSQIDQAIAVGKKLFVWVDPDVIKRMSERENLADQQQALVQKLRTDFSLPAGSDRFEKNFDVFLPSLLERLADLKPQAPLPEIAPSRLSIYLIADEGTDSEVVDRTTQILESRGFQVIRADRDEHKQQMTLAEAVLLVNKKDGWLRTFALPDVLYSERRFGNRERDFVAKALLLKRGDRVEIPEGNKTLVLNYAGSVSEEILEPLFQKLPEMRTNRAGA